MEVIICDDAGSAGLLAARLVAEVVRDKPGAVLGLATGSTPLGLYQALIEMHRREALDFSRVTTFNLDEYVGLPVEHPASYHSFIRINFLDHVNVPPERIHIPDGLADDIPAACRRYEAEIAAAGGIDVQILGIGADGHIGFNEPSSSLASRTRIKTLTEETRGDNARFFDGAVGVPSHVITIGIGTIMDARMCLLLAFGEGKAEAVVKAMEGPVTSMVPASALQFHPNAKAIVDGAAANRLQLASYYRWTYEHKPSWQRHE